MSAPDQTVIAQPTETEPRPCWSCKGPVASVALFCATCEAVQEPGQLDHYARLGLERGFDVNVKRLERAYFDLQRLLHPDRFATKTPKEKALSQQQAISLNDAYETLKDPLTRAQHLAGLMGLNVLAEGRGAPADPVVLMEAMELREALAEAESAEEVGQITVRARKDIDDCEAALSRAFESADMDAVSLLITRLKYLRKLADETRSRRARMASAPVVRAVM